MILQLFYQNPIDDTLVPVDTKTIPILLLENSNLTTRILIKNVSDLIVTDIVISATTPNGITSALTSSNTLPTAYSAGIAHTHAGALYPSEMIKLWIKPVGAIDFTQFDLDLAFNTTLIDVTDLIGLFEFTETKGSLVSESSYGELHAIPANANVIAGDGYATFEIDNSQIAVVVPTTGELSVFIKGFFYEVSAHNNVLFDAGNFKIGINPQRQVYVSIDNREIHTKISLIDPYESYVIGVSLSSNKDLIITVDGSYCILEDNTVDFTFSHTAATRHIGDSQTRAKLSYFAIYDKIKAWTVHSIIASVI